MIIISSYLSAMHDAFGMSPTQSAEDGTCSTKITDHISINYEKAPRTPNYVVVLYYGNKKYWIQNTNQIRDLGAMWKKSQREKTDYFTVIRKFVEGSLDEI